MKQVLDKLVKILAHLLCVIIFILGFLLSLPSALISPITIPLVLFIGYLWTGRIVLSTFEYADTWYFTDVMCFPIVAACYITDIIYNKFDLIEF